MQPKDGLGGPRIAPRGFTKVLYQGRLPIKRPSRRYVRGSQIDWTIHRRPWDRRPPNVIGRRPTADRPPNRLPTAGRPPTDRRPTAGRPPADRRPTANRPPTDRRPTDRRPTADYNSRPPLIDSQPPPIDSGPVVSRLWLAISRHTQRSQTRVAPCVTPLVPPVENTSPRQTMYSGAVHSDCWYSNRRLMSSACYGR